jgi:hypothetical protein
MMPPEYKVSIVIVVVSLSFVTVWIRMATQARRNRVGPAPEALAGVEQRLARLEVAVDDMAGALTRVAEGQQFLTKLLAERATDGAIPPR